jgi:hypothetical protein
LRLSLHHHYGALGTIRALLEPVADGPEKGRIVYGEFSGPIMALLEPVADDPEKGRIVYGEFLGPLGQRQAGFGGQRAGSRPS